MPPPRTVACLPSMVGASPSTCYTRGDGAVAGDWHPWRVPQTRPRVLVVDDDKAVRESLRRSLEFNGYDVVAGRRRRGGPRHPRHHRTPTWS